MSDQMGIFDVIYSTRAMRRLKPDPVAEDLLLKLVEAGNQGPTASNTQGLEWVVIRDPAQKAALAKLNKTAVDNYVGGQVRGVSKEPADPADAKRFRMMKAVVWQADHLHEIPAIIVPTYRTGTADPAARMNAGSSVFGCVQNLLLAARALGLGAALTTLGLSDRDAARELLGLPDGVEAYALIPVGYPLGKFGPVTRHPVEKTVHWDRYNAAQP